ncbi:MAG: hybrid sensor histidine kinase/response regulator [Myxococcaceae bacterium]|nr:hybrid sensor histidine kinase/response regulator [Myxococcaceae bacterium]
MALPFSERGATYIEIHKIRQFEKGLPFVECNPMLQGLAMAVTSKEQLAAEVLHEVRQPLLGLKGYLQLLRDDPARALPLTTMLSLVERMEHILGDYQRLTQQRPTERKPVTLSQVVEAAVAAFTHTDKSGGYAPAIEVAHEGEVMGSGRLLEQLVLNLLNNARDAAGSQRARTRVVVTRDEGYPCLLVADWGPGIPLELRQKIFEPYVSSKVANGGSGLGLAVCRRIAAEHDAEIDLAEPSAVSGATPPSTVFRLRFSQGAAKGLTRPKVLVVDDEPVIRTFLEEFLSRDVDVVAVAAAETALSWLKSGRFDVLLLDKNLPDMSGLEIARLAKATNPLQKVILMTGYPSLITAQESLELGLVDYLLKPFDDIREVRTKVLAAVATVEKPKPVQPENRVDIYEDNPHVARRIGDALEELQVPYKVMSEAVAGGDAPPRAVVLSWDFTPRSGSAAMAMARKFAPNAPLLVLTEQLSLETMIEALRAGAVACRTKQIPDTRAFAQELKSLLKL